MNNQYIERYAIENAQHDVDRLSNDTGIEHTVIAVADGIFAAVPVQTDDAPPVNNFLVGEPIPPEVNKKPKPRANTATVVDFKATCTEANTSKSRAIHSIIDSIGYVNIKDAAIKIGWNGGENEYPNKSDAITAACYAILDAAKSRNWNLTYKDACFYIYSGTHWQPIDDESTRHILKVLIVKFGYPEIKSRSIEFINKLFLQFVHDASALQLDYEKQSLINLQNGTLKFTENGATLHEFNSKDFATHQLDFDYNPRAQNQLFLSYLNDVLPDKDTQKTLQQIAGYLFVKGLKLELVFLLYGEGRNGKSVFQEVLTGVIGHDNVSSYSLEDLTKDTGYCRIKIANKVVNYGTDISMQSLKNDAFKVLASGEPIAAREIYRSNFEMRDYAKLIFNINRIDNANVEHTTGYFRRFLFVPFGVTISDEKIDRDLHKKILTDKAGVLNWIIEGANEVVKNRDIFVSAECEAFKLQFIKECDNVSMFEEHYIKPNLSGSFYTMTVSECYRDYVSFCQDYGYKGVLGRGNFSKRMQSIGFESFKEISGIRLRKSYTAPKLEKF
ncbi:MAG: phage/plasmid primase, P4 family [Methylococcales bacterium]